MKMTLLELNRRVGSDLMLEIFDKIPGFSLNLEKLSLDEWLNIHQKAKSIEQQKEVVKIIKEGLGVDIIVSPLVGTFTATGIWPSASGMRELVKVGERVEPDTVLCEIEAMMVQNEIKAKVHGVITEVLVKHGDAVDYNQPLFVVKPGS